MTGPIQAMGDWALGPTQRPGDPRQRLDQPFTLEGFISGSYTSEMALASGSVNFYIRPGPGYIFYIARMLVRAYDLNFIDGDAYGSAGSLATGIAVKMWDEGSDSLVYDFTPERIKAIHDWGLYAGIDSVVEATAQTDAYLCRWTFTKSCGFVVLDGDEDHVLRLEIPDDISALDGQKIMVQGYKKLS